MEGRRRKHVLARRALRVTDEGTVVIADPELAEIVRAQRRLGKDEGIEIQIDPFGGGPPGTEPNL